MAQSSDATAALSGTASSRRARCFAQTLLAASVVFGGSAAPSSAETAETAETWLRLAVEQLCGERPIFGLEAQARLPGVWLLDETSREQGGETIRLLQVFALPGGDELRIQRLAARGALRRFAAEIHRLEDGAATPLLQAQADGACGIRAGRRIDHESDHVLLRQLDGDLTTVRWTETLEAPWPEGADPGGPRVALVDSGLAYDLPLYRNRLARGIDGKPLGYDFWDLDPLPYDGDVSRGAFLPIRHGSAVASVLAREAPSAALIPLRYPRPDMSRMRDAVDHAAAAGARILAMPLGSRNPDEWRAFAEAMRVHPKLLAIVSAGNNGRDIDAEPLWPAALDLANVIVVTSADAFGKLAEGSNWGAESVDIHAAGGECPGDRLSRRHRPRVGLQLRGSSTGGDGGAHARRRTDADVRGAEGSHFRPRRAVAL